MSDARSPEIPLSVFLSTMLERENLQIDHRSEESFRACSPLDPDSLKEGTLEGRMFMDLPEDHRQFLMYSNGADIFGGAYRLFGFGEGSYRDIVDWNHPEGWKCSWNGHADQFLCFGESIVGNVYAYFIPELIEQGDHARVFELYGVTLEPIVEFTSFADFIIGGFFNGVSNDAYHTRIAGLRKRYGLFERDSLMAYAPSPLLRGGHLEGIDFKPMNAEVVMTFNGDLAVALAGRENLDGVSGIENYTDAQGRKRLRVV